jgi:hypothetical protein
MALPATDAFTGLNNTQLTTYSANWTLQGGGDFDIQSNGLCVDAGAGNGAGAYWNADTPGSNQYAQLKIALATSGEYFYLGPATRIAASGVTNYGYEGAYGEHFLYKIIAGSITYLGGAGAGIRTDDVLYLSASATTLTPKRNGSVDSEIGAVTDNAIANGGIGICGYENNTGTRTNTRADDWEGGNLTTSAMGSIPLFMMYYRGHRVRV